MSQFQVGDLVRRKPRFRGAGGGWPHGDAVLEIEGVDDDGMIDMLGDVWFDGCFELVASRGDAYHTDNDLAMALELADLVTIRVGGIVTFIEVIDKQTSKWLRAEVQRELRARGERQSKEER